MSLSPSHEQLGAAIPDVAQESRRSLLTERGIAIGFAASVGVAMVGWLFLLGAVLWNCALWLFS